ncbi:hypothetical protein AYO47_00650 [Planctomyces sp. SCGC AG-212-M04]|nr:hypothetical protein AYO47_00650 [Planctomyces sp. SCGC AG-212-M04]
MIPLPSRLLLCLFLLVTSASASAAPPERWIYISRNLQVDKSVDEIESLLKRGQAAGYTHALLTDSKFSRLGEVVPRYFDNAKKVKALAEKYKIELVPALFSIGYSNDLLSLDPNLVEALPVAELPMVVRNGLAVVDDPAAPSLKAGDMSDPKAWSLKDDSIHFEDGVARIKPNGKNARLAQKLKVTPHRQYHVSVRIKTNDFRGNPEIKALADGGKSLQWANLGVKPTQDWKEHHVIFNSQDKDLVTLYFGVWGAESGDLWWDDVAVEEVAFVNLVRRNGCPLVVKDASGKTLNEGTDFERLIDPLMGTKPYGGEYTVYHQPPSLKMKLADGTKLKVSYSHAMTVYDGQAMICPSEPKTYDLLRDQMRRMHELWGSKRYMMQHDEIRVLNQCEACRARGLTPGQILADNVRQCLKIAREVAPNSRFYVWNDMFDPYHNAVPGPYYLVNGSLEGSWEGLDKDVVIVAWYFSKRAESLKFFSDRGHKYVIAGYYDGPVGQVNEWLKTAAGIPGCEGVMYTTWQNRYGDLEAFSKVVDRGP